MTSGVPEFDRCSVLGIRAVHSQSYEDENVGVSAVARFRGDQRHSSPFEEAERRDD